MAKYVRDYRRKKKKYFQMFKKIKKAFSFNKFKKF